MAASAAEQWATTTDITKQVVGSLLQGTEGEADAILPSGVVLDAKLRDSMWKTGIPVVAAAHASTGGLEDTGEEEEAEESYLLGYYTQGMHKDSGGRGKTTGC
ncbi:hypothetical protein PC123_g20389 [Phytophthora cactorum]|nr:hypothetical protein PC123_g20389 [Phytophthora cactorum]